MLSSNAIGAETMREVRDSERDITQAIFANTMQQANYARFEGTPDTGMTATVAGVALQTGPIEEGAECYDAASKRSLWVEDRSHAPEDPALRILVSENGDPSQSECLFEMPVVTSQEDSFIGVPTIDGKVVYEEHNGRGDLKFPVNGKTADTAHLPATLNLIEYCPVFVEFFRNGSAKERMRKGVVKPSISTNTDGTPLYRASFYWDGVTYKFDAGPISQLRRPLTEGDISFVKYGKRKVEIIWRNCNGPGQHRNSAIYPHNGGFWITDTNGNDNDQPYRECYYVVSDSLVGHPTSGGKTTSLNHISVARLIRDMGSYAVIATPEGRRSAHAARLMDIEIAQSLHLDKLSPGREELAVTERIKQGSDAARNELYKMARPHLKAAMHSLYETLKHEYDDWGVTLDEDDVLQEGCVSFMEMIDEDSNGKSWVEIAATMSLEDFIRTIVFSEVRRRFYWEIDKRKLEQHELMEMQAKVRALSYPAPFPQWPFKEDQHDHDVDPLDPHTTPHVFHVMGEAAGGKLSQDSRAYAEAPMNEPMDVTSSNEQAAHKAELAVDEGVLGRFGISKSKPASYQEMLWGKQNAMALANDLAPLLFQRNDTYIAPVNILANGAGALTDKSIFEINRLAREMAIADGRISVYSYNLQLNQLLFVFADGQESREVIKFMIAFYNAVQAECSPVPVLEMGYITLFYAFHDYCQDYQEISDLLTLTDRETPQSVIYFDILKNIFGAGLRENRLKITKMGRKAQSLRRTRTSAAGEGIALDFTEGPADTSLPKGGATDRRTTRQRFANMLIGHEGGYTTVAALADAAGLSVSTVSSFGNYRDLVDAEDELRMDTLQPPIIVVSEKWYRVHKKIEAVIGNWPGGEENIMGVAELANATNLNSATLSLHGWDTLVRIDNMRRMQNRSPQIITRKPFVRETTSMALERFVSRHPGGYEVLGRIVKELGVSKEALARAGYRDFIRRENTKREKGGAGGQPIDLVHQKTYNAIRRLEQFLESHPGGETTRNLIARGARVSGKFLDDIRYMDFIKREKDNRRREKRLPQIDLINQTTYDLRVKLRRYLQEYDGEHISKKIIAEGMGCGLSTLGELDLVEFTREAERARGRKLELIHHKTLQRMLRQQADTLKISPAGKKRPKRASAAKDLSL